jgi:hypothetical protein
MSLVTASWGPNLSEITIENLCTYDFKKNFKRDTYMHKPIKYQKENIIQFMIDHERTRSSWPWFGPSW